jgi:hypothetical protein
MVARINKDEVINLSRQLLGLPESVGVHDEAFLSALVRRSAAYRCPCSPQVLVRTVIEGLQGLTIVSENDLYEAVEEAVEKATIVGDLLELHQVTQDNPNAKSTWVFGAPPAFVTRQTGTVFVVGITLDEPSPLPPSLASRLSYDGHYRLLRPEDGEDLSQILREIGLLELSEQTWLRSPRQEEAKAWGERFERELAQQGPAGEVAGLTLIEPASKPTYYKGRWTTPQKRSGMFVARRPQAYGADIWGFALLQAGALHKFLDFPRKQDHWRGSDVAWHLQMALDARLGSPQRYRVRRVSGAPVIDFFSPLPSWAERRLAIIGRPAMKEHCLFSYQFSDAELAAEIAFIEKCLWLAPIEESSGG